MKKWQEPEIVVTAYAFVLLAMTLAFIIQLLKGLGVLQ